jgi:hypothetical protein
MARRLLQIERAVELMLGKYAGFRMLMLIEKAADSAA